MLSHQWSFIQGKLPSVDGGVNALVARLLSAMPQDEMLRLCWERREMKSIMPHMRSPLDVMRVR